jgi:L-glyceraldehyde 3-phosphate reductase
MGWGCQKWSWHRWGERGQSLAQLALAWVLRQPAVTTVLICASQLAQIDDNLGALAHRRFADAELTRIDAILAAP